MRVKVVYEWSYETVDGNGDIIDSVFADHLSDFRSSETGNLVLIRNEGNEVDGVIDRFWAYVKDGKLPEWFEDGGGHEVGIKVPTRFQKDIIDYLK